MTIVGGGKIKNTSSESTKGKTVDIPTVNLSLQATKSKADNGHVNVGLNTKTESKVSGQGAKKIAIETSSKNGNDHKVKLGVGDWSHDKKDVEDIKFLICISGSKWAPEKAQMISDKKVKELDLRFDISLKGLGMNAKVKHAIAKDLKKVKCLDADGNEAWGYVGTAEDAKQLLNVSLTSAKTGDEVAKLCLDIGADKAKGFDHSDDLNHL